MNPYIKPFSGPLSEFPKDTELPEGAELVRWNDRPGLRQEIHVNVVYDRKNDVDLHLQILVPRNPDNPERIYPLIVYIPGSAWMKQSVFSSLPQMLKMCEKGYVVALTEYRHSGLASFPAQAEDAKTAIRFMRMHAKEYSADPDSVVVWGDSSGGHTALMAGLTAGSYPDNGTYRDISCSVNCIIDWYGPTSLGEMNHYPSAQDHASPNSPEGRVIGVKNVLDNPEDTAKASPINYVCREKDIPPILIMHGNRDQLVCYHQSVDLYRKLRECGKNVRFVCLDGAYHGFGGFLSDEALTLVDRYIQEKQEAYHDRKH